MQLDKICLLEHDLPKPLQFLTFRALAFEAIIQCLNLIFFITGMPHLTTSTLLKIQN